MVPVELSLIALPGLPLISAGDDLAGLLGNAIDKAGMAPQPGDVLALAQKIVSKAEGRQVALADVTPSPAAIDLAARAGKDPRLIELVLSESIEVMRVRPGLLIVRHKLGMVLANAGIDHSNVDTDGEVLLLPTDPDASCAELRARLCAHTGTDIAVVMVDSIGRAWRYGTVGTAIGASGLSGVLDLRGHPDLFDRPLRTSELGYADEIASAASLLMGQAGEGRPAVLVRGLSPTREGNAAELVRDRELDLFQ